MVKKKCRYIKVRCKVDYGDRKKGTEFMYSNRKGLEKSLLEADEIFEIIDYLDKDERSIEKEEVSEEHVKENKPSKKKATEEAIKETMEEAELNIMPNAHGVDVNFLTYNSKSNTYSVNIDNVTDYILENNVLRNVKGKMKDILYRWDGKLMIPNGSFFVKEEIEKLILKFSKRNPVDEILSKIKRKTGIDREEFENNNTNLINLNNGIWDIKKKKLIPHDPKYNFTHIIPIKYQEEVIEQSKYLKFLTEALYPEDIPVFQELLGFTLFREYFVKKGFIFVGERDGGKSVAIDSLINFIGEKNKCGLSLQDISSGTKFTKNTLKGKHLNCFDDLSSKDINDGGAFKMVTGGGFISGEEKFGDTCEFKTFATQVLAGNKVPPVLDDDDMAYFGRWIILRFDNPPLKIDPFLRDKIFTEEEKCWTLKWALEGLNRLLESGKFSYNKTPEEVKRIMQMSGDPLIQFGQACLTKEERSKISKEEMYIIYSNWANENDKPLLSKEQLGKRLNTKIKYLVAKHQGNKRYWENVKLNDFWLNKLKFMSNPDKYDTLKNNLFRIEESSINKDNNDISKIQDIKFGEVSYLPKKENKQDTNDTKKQLQLIEQNKQLLDECSDEIPQELKNEINKIKEQSK